MKIYKLCNKSDFPHGKLELPSTVYYLLHSSFPYFLLLIFFFSFSFFCFFFFFSFLSHLTALHPVRCRIGVASVLASIFRMCYGEATNEGKPIALTTCRQRLCMQRKFAMNKRFSNNETVCRLDCQACNSTLYSSISCCWTYG